jgi:hypothetical protein
MTKLREKDITLHKNKCEFNKDSLEYYGYIFAGEGISSDTQEDQSNKGSRHSKKWIGRFMKDFSTIAKPLRELTKKGVP